MAKKKEASEPLYVGVADPLSIRRPLLECSKDILAIVKGHEELKGVREEKHAAIEELRSNVRGVSLLIGKLKGALPKVKLADLEKEEAADDKVESEVRPVKNTKPQSEVEKLEAELDDIESELSQLQS
jgi:hypothetical protein